MVKTQLKKSIITYYTSSAWLYRIFCYNKSTLGMHFGFWDKDTKNRQESIINENNEILKTAKIKKGMKILDAGCGVGGTSFYIAKKTGAHVWGITIVPKQIELAKAYAKEKGLDKLTTFLLQDYTMTKFPKNFFDVVFGIESICYAKPKTAFLKEAYRILKPGGKLVIADGYLRKVPKGKKEKKIIEDFIWAFALPEFILEREMKRQIKSTGFIRISSKNMIRFVYPSIKHFATLAKVSGLICMVTKNIPSLFIQSIYKNYTAVKSFGDGYNEGLAAYYLHCAEKPK